MIEVGSDFSGVGAFNQALNRLKLNYKTVFACDMDKFARQTYIANYGEPDYYPENVYNREIPSKSLDIYMTSPPCQSFSIAGKRKGKDSENGILFFNSHEFIQKNKPRYFIFENVKGLLSDDEGRTFQEWINLLGGKSVNGSPVLFPYDNSVPYHIYHKVLNSKKHGVPQNRERIFIIGIRDDSDNSFTWPKEEPLTKRLKNVLENEVDEKYFLSDKMVNQLINSGAKTDHLDPNKKEVNNTLRCGGGGSLTEKHSFDMIKIVGNTNPSGNGMNGNVFDEEGISPTLSTNKGEGIKIKSATKKGYETAKEGDSINLEFPDSKTRRGRVGKSVPQTLDTGCNQGVIVHEVIELVSVRKHKVDVKGLQQLLKKHKKTTIQKIATAMDLPKTTLEHWFRTDKSFSIPDSEHWFKLKGLLAIETDEFDLSITEFITKEGVFEKSNRAYGIEGTAPTLTSTSADEKICIPVLTPDRAEKRQNGRRFKEGGEPMFTVTTQDRHGIYDGFRIRRLTPRECFRLQDFPDSFIIPCSDSQMYKQAGNSITVGVLEKIINRFNL